MSGSGKGIVVWDEEGEVIIWKKIGGQWDNKVVSNSQDYPTLGLKLLDSQRMLSWEDNGNICLWLEKNGSWNPTTFALNQYGPFDSHCDIEDLDDHHFVSWDDDHIFVWTQKHGEWVPEKIDVFPDFESPDDYDEEPVRTESDLDEEQPAFDFNPLLATNCVQQPSLTSEALGSGQLFERDAEVGGSDVDEVSEAGSEISDSASLTSSESSSPEHRINGVCKMDSKTVAYWVERQLMVLKQDDGGHWKSERLSEFDNSINKVRLHPEGYLVVLSKDDNDNSTISSVNIIEQSGESQVSVIARISGLWDMDLLPDGRVVTAEKDGKFTVWWEGGSKEIWFSKSIGEHKDSKPWFKVQTDGSILSWTEKGGIKHWFECSRDWIINSIGPALDSENIEIIDDCYISARVESPEHGREADDLVFYHLHPSTEGVDEKIIDV
ncbi:hypothetical protein GV64_01295 [Endozoicomonas elysicola]|uniref:Uncharacterized protein n=2 Tax=Endozoicomonas elysicola TaxID=305900 RepID=A0A081K5X8_9GAMM|nr:hypothetical protein GV64_01295 [Endozoicomonas elysicola]